MTFPGLKIYRREIIFVMEIVAFLLIFFLFSILIHNFYIEPASAKYDQLSKELVTRLVKIPPGVIISPLERGELSVSWEEDGIYFSLSANNRLFDTVTGFRVFNVSLIENVPVSSGRLFEEPSPTVKKRTIAALKNAINDPRMLEFLERDPSGFVRENTVHSEDGLKALVVNIQGASNIVGWDFDRELIRKKSVINPIVEFERQYQEFANSARVPSLILFLFAFVTTFLLVFLRAETVYMVLLLYYFVPAVALTLIVSRFRNIQRILYLNLLFLIILVVISPLITLIIQFQLARGH